MQALGPFVLNPFQNVLSGQPSNNLTVPFSTSPNGFVEIINYSTLVLQVGLQGQGTIWQESKSRCIYRCSPVNQGPQILTINALLLLKNQVPGHSFQQPQSPETYQAVFVNIYQEGETCWYSPLSLTEQETVPVSWFICQQTPQAGPYTITLPRTSDVYSIGSQATCYMKGYDIEISTTTGGAAGGDLIISGFRAQDDGNTQMVHHYKAQGSTGVLTTDRVRFPNPISNDPALGTPIACSIPGLGDAIISFTAYYFFYHAVTL